jgi:integrase
MAGTAKPYYWAARKAWYVNVRVNGKITKRKLAETKKAAYDLWRTSFQSVPLSKENPSFAYIASKWIAHQLRRRDRGEVSAEWLRRVGRTAEVVSKLQLKCEDITPAWCDEWAGGKSANYARTELSTVKQILTWAIANKLLGSHPMAGYRMPSMQSRNRILSYAEHCQLCRASDAKFKPLLRMAWLVGCRPGELRSLRWDQIDADFSRAVLVEHKTAAKVGKPRVIYFPPRAQLLLRKYDRDSQKPVKSRKTKETLLRSKFVFVNHRRKPWTKNAIVIRMKRLREDTGLDAVAYDYRHSWITRALVSGVDIATVAELSGHNSVAMISRVYGHLDQQQDHLKNAIGKVRLKN